MSAAADAPAPEHRRQLIEGSGDASPQFAAPAAALVKQLLSGDQESGFLRRFRQCLTDLSLGVGAVDNVAADGPLSSEQSAEVVAAAGSPDPDIAHIWASLELIQGWLRRYPQDRVFLTWNGGKDCTVLFHLVRIAMAMMASSPPAADRHRDQNQLEAAAGPLTLPAAGVAAESEFGSIRGLWLKPPLVFPELHEFITATAEHHRLEMVVCEMSADGQLPVPKHDYRGVLAELQRRSPFDAVFMAQRRSDPGCAELSPCTPTDVDRGWPVFDRLNPLLDWSYVQIWAFLQVLEIPFCSLYSHGYSSLGSSPSDTRQNPWLRSEDGSYLPAWKLAREERERDCRASDDAVVLRAAPAVQDPPPAAGEQLREEGQ